MGRERGPAGGITRPATDHVGEAAPGLAVLTTPSPGGFSMRRLTTWAAAAVLPALMVSAALVGCSGDNKTEPPKGGGDSGQKADSKGKGKGKTKLEPVPSTGTGTLKGRVTLEGNPPALAAMTKDIQAKMEANAQDGKVCLAGPPDEKDQQKWRIGQNKGVGNVFVWLQPPAGQYF